MTNSQLRTPNSEPRTHQQLRTPNSEFSTRGQLRSLSIIAAVSENNAIGREGDLPWHLSTDLKRFKRLTMDHAIIMGRKTWESIGRPLPGRVSIVLTRQASWRAEGAVTVTDLDAALETLRTLQNSDVERSEAFVIGGAAIYSLALPRSNRLYLTRVHAEVQGDVHFPRVEWADWRLIEEAHHKADKRNEFAHTFQLWHRQVQ